MPAKDGSRRGTLTVVSEARGKYTFMLSGELDALEWVWCLEHAKVKVLTQRPLESALPAVNLGDLKARRVG